MNQEEIEENHGIKPKGAEEPNAPDEDDELELPDGRVGTFHLDQTTSL